MKKGKHETSFRNKAQAYLEKHYPDLNGRVNSLTVEESLNTITISVVIWFGNILTKGESDSIDAAVEQAVKSLNNRQP